MSQGDVWDFHVAFSSRFIAAAVKSYRKGNLQCQWARGLDFMWNTGCRQILIQPGGAEKNRRTSPPLLSDTGLFKCPCKTPLPNLPTQFRKKIKICPITLHSLKNFNLCKTCSKLNYAFLYESCSLEWLWFVGSIWLIPTFLQTPFPSQEGNWSADGFCCWSMFLCATSQCKIAVISLGKG